MIQRFAKPLAVYDIITPFMVKMVVISPCSFHSCESRFSKILKYFLDFVLFFCLPVLVKAQALSDRCKRAEGKVNNVSGWEF